MRTRIRTWQKHADLYLYRCKIHLIFLQSYVMSDVLETQRVKLLSKLDKTKSFETVREAHEKVCHVHWHYLILQCFGSEREGSSF